MDEVIRLLADLVRIPSVNPMNRDGSEAMDHTGEARLSIYLEQYFAELGIACQRQSVSPGRDNVIAFYRSADSTRTVLFDAHQDTVPIDGMTVDPFGAFIESGRLFGRGACDVKGGMAAMLSAFARLIRERPAGSASVIMACTVDEEYTHTGSSALARALPGRVDLAVVAEPTCLDIVTSHKGAVRWRIVSRGRACHSAFPDRGDNAVYRMARVVSALERVAIALLRSKPDPVLGPPSLSVGTIQGGAAANVVPESCTIDVDRRVIPGESPESARQQVIDALHDDLDARDLDHIESEPPWVSMPALRDAVSTAELELLGQALARVFGRTPRVGGVPFGTDAGPLSQANVPCVVIGPGDIAQAHTKDEWIEIEQVRAATRFYFDLACRFG